MKLAIILGILMMFLVVACTPVKENPTIEDIVTHPGAYNGKIVTVNGTYYGWSYPDLECKNAPKMMTKSDAMVEADGYCIFMSGGKIISPEEAISEPFTTKEVVIQAQIKLFEGKPILGAVK